jgi:uncharacterized membrane protein
MLSADARMAISHAFLLLGLIVAVPWIAIAIGRAAWNGKPQNFSRFSYWIAFVVACTVFGFVFIYAQRLAADVRTSLYVVQTLLMGLAELLFGVAGGCIVAIFLYRRGSSAKIDAGNITSNS